MRCQLTFTRVQVGYLEIDAASTADALMQGRAMAASHHGMAAVDWRNDGDTVMVEMAVPVEG